VVIAAPPDARNAMVASTARSVGHDDTQNEPSLNLSSEFLGRGRLGRAGFAWRSLLGLALPILPGLLPDAIFTPLKLPLMVVVLLVLLFVLSTIVRRLHDLGMAGANLLAFAVPLANFWFFFVAFSKKGQTGVNAYGPVSSGSRRGG
jgi:uncharacterized membrane protein YhaH (DUF805 family)